MKFMQSSQKFYNPVQEDFEDELHKAVGHDIYELEVHPNLLYLGLVSEGGERTYRNAVSNGRLDLNYVKRVLKMDRIPFEEIQVSRKTTLHQILNMASKKYMKNIKRGRLLIEDQVIAGTNLFKTLEDYGLQQGQLIYAEFSNASNEFPSDVLKEKEKGKGKKVNT